MQFPADFPLSKPCGEIMCPNFYFCSAHDHQCHHCYSYCTEEENNYDQEICERDCPEYNADFLGHVINKRSINNVHDVHVQYTESSNSFELYIALVLIVLFMMILLYAYFLNRIIKNKRTGLLLIMEKRTNEMDGNTAQNLDAVMIAADSINSPKLIKIATSFNPRTISTRDEDEKNINRVDKKKETTTQKFDYNNLELNIPYKQLI